MSKTNLRGLNEQPGITQAEKIQNYIVAKEKEIEEHQKIINNPPRKNTNVDKHKKAINNCYDSIYYANRKLHDPYFMCTDDNINPAINAEMVEWYLEKVHPENDSYVATVLKYGKGVNDFYRRMMDIEDFRNKSLYLLSQEMNTYISPATFAHFVRAGLRNIPYSQEAPLPFEGETVYKGGVKESVVSSQYIVIDLDYRDIESKGGALGEDIYEELKENGFFDIVGEPSFCVVSSRGEGLQMIYLLTEPYKTYYQDKRIARFEMTIKRLIKLFKDYGADEHCSDITHLYRLPCSYNIRTNEWGYILHWEQVKDEEYELKRYDFDELEAKSKEALGLPAERKQPPKEFKPSADRPKQKTAQEAAQRPISTFGGGLYTLALNRCHDLENFIRRRNATEIQGLRNTLIFIYASQYGIIYNSEEEIYKALSKVNSMFGNPKPDKEIKIIAKRAEKKLYRYTDKKICEVLQFTETDIMLSQVIGHAQDKKEYRKNYKAKSRRTETGELKSKVNKQERNNKIKTLKEQGLTNKEISQMLNVSIRTIQYVINSKEAA